MGFFCWAICLMIVAKVFWQHVKACAAGVTARRPEPSRGLQSSEKNLLMEVRQQGRQGRGEVWNKPVIRQGGTGPESG